MIREESKKRYLAKSGDVEIYYDLPRIETDQGWFSFETGRGKEMVVVQAEGNAKELLKAIQRVARLLRAKRILFATQRNGKAFARLVKGKVVGSVIEVPICQE